ncbi:MAG: helix-turn-helix domain-containing protein [bacterium]
MPNEFILVKDAAEYLNVSTRTIQRYIKSKKVKFKTINGKVLINKDSLTGFKEVTDAVSGNDNKDKPSNGHNKNNGSFGFDWQFIKDSLDILRDQLRSKDEQIKELSNSVKELQTTQKLLIERGMNLRQLPEQTTSETSNDIVENKISIDQVDLQPKVINVQIKTPETVASVKNDVSSPITINPVKKKANYLLISIVSAIVILVLIAIYLLYKLSVKTPY